MADADYTFAQARARLDDIVTQVRKKDTSLEKSLDLLEEGVRLANACTEQIDQSEWRAAATEPQAELAEAESADAAETPDADASDNAPEVDAADVASDEPGAEEASDDVASDDASEGLDAGGGADELAVDEDSE